MTTASAWKNLRRAFRLSVGTCLFAASNQSVATFDMFVPFGRFGSVGRLGKFAKLNPYGPPASGGGVGGALGSLISAPFVPLDVFEFRAAAPSSVL